MKWQQFIWMVVPASRMREQEEWGRERQGPEECVLELVTTLQNWVMWLALAVVPARNHVEHISVLFPWMKLGQSSDSCFHCLKAASR